MLPLALFACAALLAGDPPTRLSTLESASGWKRNERGERSRDLLHLPGRDVQLFDGKSLDGWHPIGEAQFSANDGSILAQTSAGKVNSFLVSNDSFGDFLLTLELKNEQPGNSGIQIRSRVVGAEPSSSYASGYQIEIDPSSRAWSGGLYEERGRGWLQDLGQNEAGRKAFLPGEWNRYRIECVGPWIRAWVNDVPTADAFDPEALEGILALQVHSGQDTKVRFRNLQLHVFGKHEWQDIDAKAFTTDGAKLGNDFGLRLTRKDEKASSLVGCQLCFRGDRGSTRPARGAEGELIQVDNMCWSIDLGDVRLANAKEKRAWQQLTLLAYSDRVALFRDHEFVVESRRSALADGPWLWIESPSGEGLPFVRVESLEPATR